MTETTTKPRTRQKKVVPEGEKKTKEKETEACYRAVGRRKAAIARIRLSLTGNGRIEINGKMYTEYFPTRLLQLLIETPLIIGNAKETCDVSVKVGGGGFHGQAEAVRLGIARALIVAQADLKKTFRSEGLITRDPRVKERKKPGLKRARRAPQWSKR